MNYFDNVIILRNYRQLFENNIERRILLDWLRYPI
jgi:hypothetical protein